MPEKVLIVADLLNDFMLPEGALYIGDAGRAIIPHVARRIREYLEAGRDVVLLEDAHEPDDKEFALFPPHAVRDTWGGELIPEIEAVLTGGPLEHHVKKTRYSGFYDTRLEELLRGIGLFGHDPSVRAEVAGVLTSICVMDTVGDLANRDVRSVVSKKCVADPDPTLHRTALERMEKIYGAEIVD